MPKSKYFTIPASLDLSVGVDSHCDDHESTPEKLIVQTTYILSKYGKGNFCCWWVFFFPREILARILLSFRRIGKPVGEVSHALGLLTPT